MKIWMSPKKIWGLQWISWGRKWNFLWRHSNFHWRPQSFLGDPKIFFGFSLEIPKIFNKDHPDFHWRPLRFWLETQNFCCKPPISLEILRFLLKTPNTFNADTNFSSDTAIFLFGVLYFSFLNPNFHRRSPLKILGVSNENIGVFNENLGSPMKICGSPMKILGSLAITIILLKAEP